jgi:hypothetical protein
MFRTAFIAAMGLAAAACSISGGRYGLPASTHDSFAAAPAHAERVHRDVCLPAVVEGAQFKSAVDAVGAVAQENPFNQRIIYFPETSYATPAIPRVHVWITESQGQRICTIAAMDGSLNDVLSGWEDALRAAGPAHPVLDNAESTTLPPLEALEDAQARRYDLGGGHTAIVSSDAERARVVSDTPGGVLLSPATGVLLTITGPI